LIASASTVRQKGLDVETRQHADEPAPHQGREDVDPARMGDRRRREIADVLRPLPVGEDDRRHVDHAAMRNHHALRAPGRAAGIGEPADRLRVGFVHKRRGFDGFHLGDEVAAAFHRPERQQMFEARRPTLDGATPRGKLRAFHDQGGGLGVVDDEGLVVFGREWMQRRIAQPHRRRGGHHRPGFDPVRRQERDPVAFLKAQRPEEDDKASRRLPEFAIGPTGLIVGDGGAIGKARNRRDQHRSDRAAFVQRPHEVLPGLFGRT
jgi:hypothetical protein